jgi:CDP-diacylglycerol--glycerol-3-phosphate 3-phosphatidyltransferase
MNQDNLKTKITDPSRILTLANFISLLRALLSIPIIYTLKDEQYLNFTFWLIVIAILSDALDGWVARKSHNVTHFGQWLDPISDFIVILAVTAFMVYEGRFPAWFFIFYIFRYVSIALPAIYLLNHTNFVLHSNWWGKWGAGITTMGIFFHIFTIETIPYLPFLCLVVASYLLIISWIRYYKTFIQEFKSL